MGFHALQVWCLTDGNTYCCALTVIRDFKFAPAALDRDQSVHQTAQVEVLRKDSDKAILYCTVLYCSTVVSVVLALCLCSKNNRRVSC